MKEDLGQNKTSQVGTEILSIFYEVKTTTTTTTYLVKLTLQMLENPYVIPFIICCTKCHHLVDEMLQLLHLQQKNYVTNVLSYNGISIINLCLLH